MGARSMKKLLTGAVLALPLLGSIGTGAAIAATGYPRSVVENAATASQAAHVYQAGYYVTTCHWQVVGYTWRGQPVSQYFCN